MGALAAPPYLLLLASPGTTWSLAGGPREGSGRSRDVYPVVRVQGAAPVLPPERLRQELMAAPHLADLAGINSTIYTHANQL